MKFEFFDCQWTYFCKKSTEFQIGTDWQVTHHHCDGQRRKYEPFSLFSNQTSQVTWVATVPVNPQFFELTMRFKTSSLQLAGASQCPFYQLTSQASAFNSFDFCLQNLAWSFSWFGNRCFILILCHSNGFKPFGTAVNHRRSSEFKTSGCFCWLSESKQVPVNIDFFFKLTTRFEPYGLPIFKSSWSSKFRPQFTIARWQITKWLPWIKRINRIKWINRIKRI